MLQNTLCGIVLNLIHSLRESLYVAGTLYKDGDFKPYMFKTKNYGETWTKIVSGIQIILQGY